MAVLNPADPVLLPAEENRGILLGGYAAMAESAWMGSVQAADVLESLRPAPAATPRRVVLPRLPRIRLAGLYTRELNIAEASFVLMASFFLSALLGAVRQVLFNAQFGAGTEASDYYAAFRLPDTLFSLIAGGALSSAMIPVLLSTARDEGAAARARLVNLVLTCLMAVFAVVILLGELFTPFFVTNLLAPGFDGPTSALTVQLTRVMLIQPLILTIGSVATAVLNSRNQFVPTAFSILGHNIALISGIAASGLIPGLGILGPTYGVVAGGVLQVLFLLPGLSGRGLRLAPRFDLADRRLREIGRLLAPNGLSVGVNYAGFIVDTAFGSRSVQVAGLPALFNAWMLVGLPIALIGQAIGQAAFPRLADHAAALQWREMRQTLLRALAAAMGLALPALLALLLLGRLVIRILFEHGNFDPAAGDLTFQVLEIYAVGLPFYVTTELVTRGLIALRDTRTPLITNVLQLAGRILLMVVLFDRMDVLAVPTAFAVSASAETLLLSTVLWVKLQRKGAEKQVEALGRLK
jgi:putative peptidoglycan lipid II flippase